MTEEAFFSSTQVWGRGETPGAVGYSVWRQETRATIEVHHFFSNTTPQFGSLKPLPKTGLEEQKTATG